MSSTDSSATSLPLIETPPSTPSTFTTLPETTPARRPCFRIFCFSFAGSVAAFFFGILFIYAMFSLTGLLHALRGLIRAAHAFQIPFPRSHYRRRRSVSYLAVPDSGATFDQIFMILALLCGTLLLLVCMSRRIVTSLHDLAVCYSTVCGENASVSALPLAGARPVSTARPATITTVNASPAAPVDRHSDWA
ncbi:unnamed protein product [Oikopleura dioica]|uniref:Uncharacterized protein n=1 Tax=Oikopleura dioica TaxID=34765 RepID=E4XYS0_OIKDI|nr:unnamed protein product [Oikopleura dioica]